MSTWFYDYVNGASGNDGIGPWKVAYTLGTGAQPALDETATGSISGATAKVLSVTGTWAVSGTIYFYDKSGTFQAETLNFTGGGACTIAADLAVSAKQTFNDLGTSGAPGDTHYMAKSPDPVSIGNADWTDASATITLASAATTNIETCETVWTAGDAVNVTVTAVAMTEGTYGNQLAIGVNFATGIIAYKDITTLDLSTKQKASFIIYASVAVLANTLRLDLCSDNVGAVPVNSFTIPYKLEAGRYYRFTFNPDAGAGNLGNAIESVALYALLDPGTTNIRIDNILACTTSGLALDSVIGKNTSGETFWCIKSINDTTVILGESQQAGSSVTKYYGTTETVTTYIRETIKTLLATGVYTNIQQYPEAGTSTARMNFVCGYDPATNTRNGETWFDGNMGWGNAIYNNKNYCDISYIGLVRYYYNYNGYDGLDPRNSNIHCNGSSGHSYFPDITPGGQITNLFCVQNAAGNGLVLNRVGFNGENITLLSNNNGLILSTSATGVSIKNLISRGNTYNIILGGASSAGGDNRVLTGTLGNAVTADVYQQGALAVDMENVEFLSSTEFAFASAAGFYNGGFVASQKHDKTSGTHKKWFNYKGLQTAAAYYTLTIDTVIPGGGLFSSRITPGDAVRYADVPCLVEPVDSAGNLTVSVDVRESVVGDGTDYNGQRIQLIAKQNVAIGITEDTIIATATVASEGAFETISGTLSGASITPADNGGIEFVIRCDGTTGWINFKNVVAS